MSALNFSLQLAGPIAPKFLPPAPTAQCQVTDMGISIIVQVLDSSGNPVNLRTASSLTIITTRPSGVVTETKASFLTNGFDGNMYFVTSPSSPAGTGLDEVGIWQVQAKIVTSGLTQFTTVGYFQTFGNLGA